MKKRWLAVLLTMAMCLSLLPNLAMAAEEEVWTQPRLFMSAPDREDDLRVEPASNDFATSESFGLGQGRFEIFYFGTQESYEKVALKDLEFSGPIELEVIEEAEVGTGLYGYVGRISGTGIGTGTVSYTVDGTDYTVTFEIGLPEFGIYSEQEPSAQSYLTELEYDGTDNDGNPSDTEIFYIICTEESYTMTSVSCTVADAFMSFSAVEGQKNCWMLKLTDGFDSGKTYYLDVSYLDEGAEKQKSVSCKLLDTRPEEEAPVEPGLYSQPIMAPEYYLGDELIYTGEPLEFYVLWNTLTVNGIGGFNGVDLSVEDDSDFEIYDENGKPVGYKLIAPDAQPGDYSFDLRIPGDWLTVEFRIVDPRPLFRCRALTKNGDTYSLDEDAILRTIVSGAADETVGYVFYEVRSGEEIELPLEKLSFPAGVTATALNADKTWLALTFGQTSGEVSYTTEENTELTLPVVISNADTGNWGDSKVQTFELDGTTYKIGLASGGFVYDDIPLLTLHGDHQTVTAVSQDEVSWDDYVMAVVDEDGNFVENLSGSIKITDVAITEFYSLGGTCSAEIAKEDIQYYGTPLKTITLTTQGAFVAEISVTYSLKGATASGSLEVQGVADFRYRVLPQGVYNLDLSAADTAAELNALLSSPEALVEWMEDNAPEEYQLYTILKSMGDMGMSHFNLYLPAVTYDDIIVVQLKDAMVNIYGATDRNGNLKTVMPGLHLKDKSPACNLIEIHFKHDAEKELVYEGLSCAILACGDENNLGDGNCIESCLIEDFDCGVRNTPYGHIGLGMNNLIRNCGYGLYMDCAGKKRGSVYTEISHSVFTECNVGVYFKSLPEYNDDYDYRIYYCDFIDVATDFQVDAAGRYYFYRNFYGHLDKNAGSLEEVERMEQVQYQKPQVVSSKDATVFTNPRRVVPFNILDGRDNDALCIDNGRETSDGLIVITENYIPNSEADKLVMDTALLSEEVADSGEAISLNIVDENQKIQATWTIN